LLIRIIFPATCLGAAFIGVGARGEADITPFLLTRYFGFRAFSTLYGLTWTFYAAAGTIGPIILGRAFDSGGSFASLLVILAGITSVSALLIVPLPAIRTHRPSTSPRSFVFWLPPSFEGPALSEDHSFAALPFRPRSVINHRCPSCGQRHRCSAKRW
jgi:hypothetical protein